MDLAKKYPFIDFVETDYQSSEYSSDAYLARQREIWRRDQVLLETARNHIKDANIFLHSRFHDSKVISAKLADDCLTITVNDLAFADYFQVVNSYLGLCKCASAKHRVGDDEIKIPVSLRIEGIKVLNFFEHDGKCFVPVPAKGALSIINEYLYDELSRISSRSVSIGFIFHTKKRKDIILDIDARRISFDQNLRSNFISYFGEENVDIFDALWQARNNRTLGWDVEPAIKIIRSLRPQLPAAYDVQDYYIYCGLKMEADELKQDGKISKALDIYKQIEPSHWNRSHTWMAIGESLMKLKHYSEAILYLFAVLGSNPKHIEARFLLAQAYHRQKNPDSAAYELEKILKIDPNCKVVSRYIAKHKDIQECIEE